MYYNNPFPPFYNTFNPNSFTTGLRSPNPIGMAMRSPNIGSYRNSLGILGRNQLGGGILSKLKGSGFNFSTILNNTQKTLNVVNQAIPIIKQTGPMVKNLKTMVKLATAFKDETTNTNTNITNNVNTNNINNESTIKEENINKPNYKSNSVISDNGPDFFI